MASEENVSDLDRGFNALRALITAAGKSDEKPKGKAFANIEASLEYGGKKIILPDDPRRMTPREAREWLNRIEVQEETQVQVVEPIKGVHPFDGAVALMKAFKQIYNWVSPVPTPGFFGSEPPTTISIETGPKETAVIFWGSFNIPGLGDSRLETGIANEPGSTRPVFQITGVIRRKYVEAVHELAELTRKIAREDSIYRGKALSLNVQSSGQINWQAPPQFLDLSRVNPDELVLAETVQDEIQTNLWTIIEHTKRCRAEKVPLKRGVLLEGPYGTGKTMASAITAVKCVASGWTYVTIPDARALEPALHFAAFYQPCVLFVEDVDRQMQGERNAAMDLILNTVDGVASKGSEIVVCFTSNAANLINRAMMRPGRLDAVIHMDAPDAKAAERLVRVYGRNLVKADEDLRVAGEALAGKIPAVIRECVERSKLYAISQRPEAEFHLTGEDVARAARGMAHHLSLLDAKPAEKTSAEIMADALIEVLSKPVDEKLSKVAANVRMMATALRIGPDRLQ